MHHVSPADAEGLQQFEFFPQRGETRRRLLRRKHFPGMRLEGQGASGQCAGCRDIDQSIQHRLVPPVDAIEIADGDGRTGRLCA